MPSRLHPSLNIGGSILAAGLVLVFAACSKSASTAHDAAPHHGETTKTVAAPSASDVWGRINGRRKELAQRMQAKNLKDVHELAEALAADLKGIPGASTDLAADKRQRVEGAVNNLLKALDALHDAADNNDQRASERHLQSIEELFQVVASQYPSAVATATSMTMATEHGAGGDHSHDANDSTVTARIETSEALVPGKTSTLTLRLTNKATGKLLTASDLEEAHTKKLHLLIIDPSLSDYHHEHPTEVSPGVWRFSLTPRTGGEYVVFSDILPTASKSQEYVRTTLAVTGAVRTTDKSVTKTAKVDGYRFDLEIEGDKIRVNGGGMVKVRVSKPDGSPMKGLEPVMGAFAHGVGFTADLETVLHVHPLGDEPANSAQRGGPELGFHLAPQKPGYYKFYIQVQIDGKDRFAPFGIDVLE